MLFFFITASCQATSSSLGGMGNIYTDSSKGRFIMGEWVGGFWFFTPFDFSYIFELDNKKQVLIPKKYLQVARAFYMKSYDHFQFKKNENWRTISSPENDIIIFDGKCVQDHRNVVIFPKQCNKKNACRYQKLKYLKIKKH